MRLLKNKKAVAENITEIAIAVTVILLVVFLMFIIVGVKKSIKQDEGREAMIEASFQNDIALMLKRPVTQNQEINLADLMVLAMESDNYKEMLQQEINSIASEYSAEISVELKRGSIAKAFSAGNAKLVESKEPYDAPGGYEWDPTKSTNIVKLALPSPEGKPVSVKIDMIVMIYKLKKPGIFLLIRDGKIN